MTGGRPSRGASSGTAVASGAVVRGRLAPAGEWARCSVAVHLLAGPRRSGAGGSPRAGTDVRESRRRTGQRLSPPSPSRCRPFDGHWSVGPRRRPAFGGPGSLLQQFQGEEQKPLVFADVVDVDDVGMVQAGDHLGLAAKAHLFLRPASSRPAASSLQFGAAGLAGLVDDAHAAAPLARPGFRNREREASRRPVRAARSRDVLRAECRPGAAAAIRPAGWAHSWPYPRPGAPHAAHGAGGKRRTVRARSPLVPAGAVEKEPHLSSSRRLCAHSRRSTSAVRYENGVFPSLLCDLWQGCGFVSYPWNGPVQSADGSSFCGGPGQNGQGRTE